MAADAQHQHEEKATYEDMRRLVAWVRLTGEESAPLCAAMLSILDRRQHDGAPVPGYVELWEQARGRV